MYLLSKMLRRVIKRGTLAITDADGRTYEFGNPAQDYPDLAIRFADSGASRSIALGPRLGAAEAFMDGRLIIERGDIMSLIQLLRQNNPWEKGGKLEKPGFSKRMSRNLFRSWRQFNYAKRARTNVAHHYDLTDDFYALFLDTDRQYSCAYWTDANNSLEQAQADKKAHIAAKLSLEPGQRVLDIGCGWGGMALYLHEKAGVDVLGVTLSERQLDVARRRASDLGVSDHVRFELTDYRDLSGQFDRIVSVGMFEHVGTPYYRAFFRKCANLLTPEGVMLIHTIGRMGSPGSTDAFTRKYIFPGGYIPALSEIVSASEPARLIATDVEDLRLHYALTLRQWYARVLENEQAITAMYDERFFRMWSFYLAGATAAFEHGGMVNYQLQYARNRRSLPITRDYMHGAEMEYRGPKPRPVSPAD